MELITLLQIIILVIPVVIMIVFPEIAAANAPLFAMALVLAVVTLMNDYFYEKWVQPIDGQNIRITPSTVKLK